MRSILLTAFIALAATIVSTEAFGQTSDPRVAEARAAIARGEFARARSMLDDLTRQNPSADAYLYLGIAYGNMKEYARAEETFVEGARRYPDDPRFHNEIAGTHLARRNTDLAREALKQALKVDPGNEYAADLLANLDISQGNVQSALDAWNHNGRPVVSEILHNRYPGFGHWTVEKSLAFEPGDILRYSAWRTTERRLAQTGLFSNVGVDIEPTAHTDRYDIDVRTSLRKNTRADLFFGVIRGLPFQATYFDVWNIGGSGTSFNSFYRWQEDRRRADLILQTPIPLPGILMGNLHGAWRSELWNVSDWTVTPSDLDTFHYESTGMQIMFRHIPHYRVEIGAGLEYRNRIIDDSIPVPSFLVNGNNSGKILGETTISLWDRGATRGRIRADGYIANRSILGDLNYSAGVVEFGAQWTPRSDPRNSALWKVTAGTSRGQLPIDDYFVIGVEPQPRFLLRGHSVVRSGVSGNAPLGSAFLLSNLTLAREIRKIPTFNAANMPFISVRGEFFLDTAKVFDRARIFKQDELFIDLGVGLQFATPTHAFHLIYGQSVTDGRRALTAYAEKTW